MEIIREAKKEFADILNKQIYRDNATYVPVNYLHKCEIEHGILVENTLTSQVILMSHKERESLPDDVKKVLIENWYMIPEDMSERTICYALLSSWKTRYGRKDSDVNNFTIFTTTECNAHCPYCYEGEWKQRKMSDEVALDVAKYIERGCGNRQVNIGWFGGEPLYNYKTMDIITEYLSEHGISYQSSIITNGYLIKDHTASEFTDKWKINRVQITLDGTQDIYNRVKAYDGDPENAFIQVLDNVDFLANCKIRVSIRLNLSNDNADDLLELIPQLKERFGRNSYVSVYVHPIFDCVGENDSDIYDHYIKIDKALGDAGVRRTKGVDSYSVHHCMADNDAYACITPEGNLSPCEHYSEDELLGNIYDGITDVEKASKWKEPADETEICLKCWYYPKCNRLKKCPTECQCTEGSLKYLVYREDEILKNVYNSYAFQVSSAQPAKKKTTTIIDPQIIVDVAMKETGKTLMDRDYWKEIFPISRLRGWCMAFIYAMFETAYGTDTTHTLLGMTDYHFAPHVNAKHFKSIGSWMASPKIGDIAFFCGKWTNHAELVVGVDDMGFYTVGGNIKDMMTGVSSVQYRHHGFTDPDVTGFGRPKWSF